MGFIRIAFLSIALVVSAPGQAFAFNFGFVRVPDWMDPYLVALSAFTLFSMAGLAIVKPKGIPMNQLGKVELSPPVRFIRYILILSLTVFMVMLFAGMGLRRYAEW